MQLLYFLFAIFVVGSEAASADWNAVPKFEQCGGSLEADSGSISYPSESSTLVPGELCVWTIHLKTMTNFRFNFTKLDVIGGSNDCLQAEVGLYSLSNFLSNQTDENYRFCTEIYPWRAFLLPENVAAIVLRTSEVSSPGAGFTLTWEGTRGVGITIEHTSSYTSVPSGLMKYPFNGLYAPNTVSTWLFNGPPNGLGTNVNISGVSLESCPLSDPCWCDALVLYQVANDGVLKEVTRVCEDGSDISTNVASTFILAFYTDYREEAETGYGFQMSYEALSPPTSTPVPTTSITTRPTTEPTTGPPPITSCGGVFDAKEGVIEYQFNQVYEPNLRCVWILKSNYSYPSGVYIIKETSAIGVANDDYISVYGFNQQGNDDMQAEFGHVNGIESTHYYASMVVIVFTTDGSFTNTGFRMRYYFDGYTSDAQTELLTDEPFGTIRVPTPGSKQVSLFVFSRNFQSFGNTGVMGNLTMTDVQLEDCDHPDPACCCDQLNVYQMEEHSLNLLEKTYKPAAVYGPYNATDLFIVALGTPSFSYGKGFRLNWSWE